MAAEAALRPTAAQNAKDLDRITARIDRMEKSIYGNGDPGMDEQIRSIVKWIEERKKREDFIYYTTIGAALTALVASVVSIVVAGGS